MVYRINVRQRLYRIHLDTDYYASLLRFASVIAKGVRAKDLAKEFERQADVHLRVLSGVRLRVVAGLENEEVDVLVDTFGHTYSERHVLREVWFEKYGVNGVQELERRLEAVSVPSIFDPAYGNGILVHALRRIVKHALPSNSRMRDSLLNRIPAPKKNTK